MVRLLHLLFILVVFLQISSFAQCCSAGNPFFYSEQANMGHRELQVMTGYKYSSSDTYFKGSEPVSVNFVDHAYFNYLNIQLLYGLTPRISLQTDLGYFVNKTESYSLEDWSDSRGYGLGDAALTVKYLAYKNFIGKYSIIPSIGIKFPVGVFDQEVDNVKLPITVQPSSGSYKYALNVYVNKGFKKERWNLGFFGSFEYAQLIDSENFYYKYGNQYLFSLITSCKVGGKVNAGLEIRNESRGRSERENDQVIESSGYNIVYAIPHLSFAPFVNWLLAVNADWPVYRYYNGVQLGNKAAVTASLSYRLNFNGEPKE